MIELCSSRFDLDDGEAVERPSPAAAPTAFRIWKSGTTKTDFGISIFSGDSAKKVMHRYEARNNLVSIDVDHASFKAEAPPAARKAVGWHKLQLRQDGSLWAVDVEWSPEVKAGLEATPPEWRYFSPAYEINKETREIVSYLNTSLTNNPATWNVNALANMQGKEGEQMKFKELCAALAAIAQGGGEDAPMAEKMLGALAPEDGKEKMSDAEGSPPSATAGETAEEEEPGGPPSSKQPVGAAEAPGGLEAASLDGSAAVALASVLQRVEQRLDNLEQRDERARLLKSRPDFTKSVRAWLSKASIEVVREACSTIPKGAAPVLKTPIVQRPTLGEGQKSDGRSSRLPPDEKVRLDNAMGLGKKPAAIVREGTSVSFGILSREEADKVLSKKE